jgi:twitching motility protein PilU
LSAQHTKELVRSVMNDRQTEEFESKKEANFAINPPGIGRFRVSAFIQQGCAGMVLRKINTEIPTFDKLNLPEVLQDIALIKRGLVILSAVPARANPPRWRHWWTGATATTRTTSSPSKTRSNTCISTRSASSPSVKWVDTEDWEIALKNTLRQAPDVILMGKSATGKPWATPAVCRNRPPVPGHAACQQCQPGTGPHSQLLPGRASPAGLMDLSLNMRSIISQRLLPSNRAGPVAAVKSCSIRR